jgi:uncharacterized protein YfaS (alpha-2-macroglobulin family)
VALSVDDSGPTGLVIRRDFSDAAYWNALVRTDATGKARVEFKLPDSLTTWQVVVTAVMPDLHVGRHQTTFGSMKPLMVRTLLPRFFTEGDTTSVSAYVYNHTDSRQTIVASLHLENSRLRSPADVEVSLAPGGIAPVSWDIQAGEPGSTQVLVSAKCTSAQDAASERLPVVRAAPETVVTRSGFCTGTAEIHLPNGVDPKSARLEVRIVPELRADLVDTLDYLVEYPYGCVEQTMSRFLPAIKVAQILKETGLKHPRLEQKLPHCVNAGIKRLLELQQQNGSWGWYGSNGTSAVMTAYALYGLLEAEKAGYPVGWENAVRRGLAQLKSFIEGGHLEPTDTVYCMYVFGHRLEVPAAWWRSIEEWHNKGSLSDHARALALELAVRKRQSGLADSLARSLRGSAHRDGDQVSWQTARFSCWADNPLEITAAVLKALVAYDPHDPLIPGMVAYFAANKRDNHWKSTKDTALIVHALCDHVAQQKIDLRALPTVGFRCNDGPLVRVSFEDLAVSQKVTVPSALLRTGVNRLEFGNGPPGVLYRAVLRFRAAGGETGPQAEGIRVTREFWLLDEQGRQVRQLGSGDEVPCGAHLECRVTAASAQGTEMRHVLVESPKPSGCEVVPEDDRRFDQSGTERSAREDRDALIAFIHEQTPEKLLDRCIFHVERAGDYLVSPAHAELMYDPETRGHSGTFRLRVVDKALNPSEPPRPAARP